MESLQSQLISVKSSGVALVQTSKTRAHTALQPYYIKVNNGIATIVARAGDVIVVIKMKVADASSKVRVRVVDSLAQAKAVIEPYTSPLLSRVTTLQDQIAHRTQYFKVTIEEGIVRIRGAVGDHYVSLKASLSDVAGAIYAKATNGTQGVKDAILNLNAKLTALVAAAYGETLKRFQMLRSCVCQGYLYVACLVNQRIVVLKLKVSEVLAVLQSKSSEMYSTTLEALTSTYSGVKTSVLHATENSRTKAMEISATTQAKVAQATQIAKTKAIKAGTAARTLVSDPKAQVTAGSAVVLGTTGGAAGLVAGGAAGAACGLPAALFTFGLSIPVGAAIGAGAGLCVGTVAGGAAGGAAGYSANKHKVEIGNGFAGAINKAKVYKESAQARAMRVIGHTGGTTFA